MRAKEKPPALSRAADYVGALLTDGMHRQSLAHSASNGRQDLVFALPISVCTIVIGRGSLLGEVGMATAIVDFAVLLYGLTVIVIRLRQELKRTSPCQEL
jgi:hypothetical protein